MATIAYRIRPFIQNSWIPEQLFEINTSEFSFIEFAHENYLSQKNL